MGMPDKLLKLVTQLSTIFAFGPKAAERMALELLDMPKDQVAEFVQTLSIARRDIHFCPDCGNFTDHDLCPICSDKTRDRSIICVVEKIQDLMSIEHTGTFHGTYFVLHGLLDPMVNKRPENLNIPRLLARVSEEPTTEIVFALSSSFNGDITTAYIAKELPRKDIQLSRLAVGIARGADLQYTDTSTLSDAFEHRKEFTA